jgi:hypothetical protein
MRKLTATQISNLSKGHGLFNISIWKSALSYLFTSLADADPPNADGWNSIVLLFKSTVEWVLQAAEGKYGSAARECLKRASSESMDTEYTHAQNEKKCIFSKRLTPQVYEIDGETKTTSERLHRRFFSWQHHKETGLICPHYSPYYVYESHFSHLIEAVYAIGHMPSILRALAVEINGRRADDDTTEEVWLDLREWRDIYSNINSMMESVWVYLDPGLTMR